MATPNKSFVWFDFQYVLEIMFIGDREFGINPTKVQRTAYKDLGISCKSHTKVQMKLKDLN